MTAPDMRALDEVALEAAHAIYREVLCNGPRENYGPLRAAITDYLINTGVAQPRPAAAQPVADERLAEIGPMEIDGTADRLDYFEAGRDEGTKFSDANGYELFRMAQRLLSAYRAALARVGELTQERENATYGLNHNGKLLDEMRTLYAAALVRVAELETARRDEALPYRALLDGNMAQRAALTAATARVAELERLNAVNDAIIRGATEAATINLKRLARMEKALRALLTDKNGELIGAGYQYGGGNVVMVLEVSVNNVLDARAALAGDK